MRSTAVTMGSSSGGRATGRISRQRDHALGEIDGQIAHALEIIGDLERGHDLANFLRRQVAVAQHAHGVIVDDHFHLVDAGFEQKDLVQGPVPCRRRCGPEARTSARLTLASTVRAMEIR